MKMNHLKWSILGLSLVLTLNSCVQEEELNQTVATKPTVESISALVSGSENLRKSPSGVIYQEKFTNQSIAGSEGVASFAFPGFGVGNATYLGKSQSFFNQYATAAPDARGVVHTIAAPVTEYFSEQIAALGLDVDLIDAHSRTVSTLTTDGKGNAIFFNNIENTAQFDQSGNITFEAEIEIVGGMGVFAKASGFGTVVGNISGTDGKGTTVVEAEIHFN